MTDPVRVLLVEDEAKTADTVALYLRHEGYRVTVSRDGTRAQALLATEPWDLLVVDRMVPGVDGLTLARQLRAAGDVPVIVLTAMVQESERLEGFAAGIDDYVTKPFSPRELVARCQAVLRRAGPRSARARGVVRCGRLAVDAHTLEAWCDDAILALSPTEARLLLAFVGAPGRTFTRDELAERGLRGGSDVDPRTVDAHVKNLRRKLDDAQVPCIRTVFGVGYRLDAAEVRPA